MASDWEQVIKCASCGNSDLEIIWDFKDVPLAGYFPISGSENLKNLIPMVLMQCSNCFLVQVNPNVSDSLLFEDYRYVSSVGMQRHFNEFAEWFVSYFAPIGDCEILEIGCNDGPLLESLTKLGFKPIGIDPASNIVKLATAKSLNVVNDFFSLDSAEKYNFESKFDFVISCNSFAHISKIREIAAGVSFALKENGKFIVEVQSFYALVNSLAFDFVYHEHKFYYTLNSIENLLKNYNLYLVDVELITSHGGSYRLTFSNATVIKSDRLNLEIERESASNIFHVKDVKLKIKRFMENIDYLGKELQTLKDASCKIIGFGASGRANMQFNYLGEKAKLFDYVIDESKERIGRNLAFSGVVVKDYSDLKVDDYDVCVILAWNFADQIMAKMQHSGKIFIIPFPEFKVIRT